ncbi:MAG: hypothetical protein FJ397_06735 [Verrucomicrobia bacterium]|nr:hypothetical protein [Verrucomicrobiota bacterium]
MSSVCRRAIVMRALARHIAVHRRAMRSLGLVSALWAATHACSPDLVFKAPEVGGVNLSPGTLEMGIGEEVTVSAVAYGTDGTPFEGAPLSWSTSNAGVVSVSVLGRVRAVGAGTAQVRASFGGRSGVATVTVGVPVASVTAIPGVEFQFVVSDRTGGYVAAGRLTAPASVAGRTLTPAGTEDGIVVRFASDLVPTWAAQVTRSIGALSVSPNQQVQIAVNHSGAVTLTDAAGASTSFTSTGGTDGVIFILAGTGGRQGWIRITGGSATDAFDGVVSDAAGNLYVSGSFNGCCASTGSAVLSTDAGGSLTLSSIGFQTGFLAQITSTRGIGWRARYGGRDASLRVAAIDPDREQVYVMGSGPNQSSGSIVDGAGGSTSLTCANTPLSCPFISAFSTSTGALRWRGSASFAGGGDASVVDMASSSTNGDVYALLSCYGGTVTFGTTASSTTVTTKGCTGSATNYQRLVVRYSSAGTPLAAETMTASGFQPGPARGGLAVTSGGVAVATQFQGTLTFAGTTLTATGQEDGALLMLSSSLGVNASSRLSGASGSINRLNDVIVTSTGARIVVGGGVDQSLFPDARRLSGTGGFIVSLP